MRNIKETMSGILNSNCISPEGKINLTSVKKPRMFYKQRDSNRTRINV